MIVVQTKDATEKRPVIVVQTKDATEKRAAKRQGYRMTTFSLRSTILTHQTMELNYQKVSFLDIARTRPIYDFGTSLHALTVSLEEFKGTQWSQDEPDTGRSSVLCVTHASW